MADALVASIAQSQSLGVVARNARQFCFFGVRTATLDEIDGRPLP